jgi:hypothetical protein
MNINNIISNVNSNNLYDHILHLEGLRNPLSNMQGLKDCSEYIRTEFEKAGLYVREQSFKVEGFAEPFKNIIGNLRDESGDLTGQDLIIAAHYDTTEDTPGADDNLSGVAAMLEIARLIVANNAEIPDGFNIQFVAFTLEEGSPSYRKSLQNLAWKYNIVDSKNRFKSWNMQKLYRRIYKILTPNDINPNKEKDARKVLEQHLEIINENEYLYLNELIRLMVSYSKAFDRWYGNISLVGSNNYAKHIKNSGKKVKIVINLETIGFCSNVKNSQRLPFNIPSFLLKALGIMKTSGVNLSKGNWVSIVANKQSAAAGEAFFKQTKIKAIRLPAVLINLPLNFDLIYKKLPDLLRSDHSPFWRLDIPAIILSDTANFRNPYYHTPADTIDKLDFDFLVKIVQTTIAAIFSLCR